LKKAGLLNTHNHDLKKSSLLGRKMIMSQGLNSEKLIHNFLSLKNYLFFVSTLLNELVGVVGCKPAAAGQYNVQKK
jgi:hypothetical protein